MQTYVKSETAPKQIHHLARTEHVGRHRQAEGLEKMFCTDDFLKKKFNHKKFIEITIRILTTIMCVCAPLGALASLELL